MADDENNLVGSSFSLVRYNNPVLIDKKTDLGNILSPSSPTPGGSAAGSAGVRSSGCFFAV